MMRRGLIVFVLIFGVFLRMIDDRRIPVELNTSLASFEEGADMAVFAAYSEDGSVPDYVINYLKKLKEIAPNIVYVTDNPIQKKEVGRLKGLVKYIIAGRHGEYDWGSYKRGYNLFSEKGLIKPQADAEKSDRKPMLYFANDSALPVVESFRPITEKMNAMGADFWGITANEDGMYHLQSYFLAFVPAVYTGGAFWSYLNNVRGEKNGLNVAYRYEVPFTAYLNKLGFKEAVYIPYEELRHLPLNDKNCYPVTLLNQWGMPLLKMRTFTERLTVQEPRRLVFDWLKKNAPKAYNDLKKHLKKIKSPYLNEDR